MSIETKSEVTGVDTVVCWRREQLTQVGFEDSLALRLAIDVRWDLHALIELVERGCPPQLAARILAPIDEEWDAA